MFAMHASFVRLCHCALAFALIANHPAQAQTIVQVPRLPMEAHGFNDIATWPGLLSKGIRWFKIDIGICERSSCQTYSTWSSGPGTGSPQDCFNASTRDSQAVEEFCCLCMRGDTSSRPYLLDPFNTTYDLIAFFDAEENQAVLPHVGDGDRGLTIGLDFGTGSVFNGPDGCFFDCPAAGMLRAWISAWYEVIQRRGLAVRGANDSGMQGWFQDLDQRCAAGQCSASDLALQSVPFPSQAGAGWVDPAGDPYHRFQIVNDDYTTFSTACAQTTWRPVPGNVTPWLWYEQTGQSDFLNMLSMWTNCSSLPNGYATTPDMDLVMVSNMAPEMMEVFSAASGVTGRGVNAQIAGSHGYSQPWLVAIPVAPGTAPTVCAGCDRFLLLAAQTAETGSTVWTLPMTGATAPTLSSALGSVSWPTGTDGSNASQLVSFGRAQELGETDDLPQAGDNPLSLITAISSSGTVVLSLFNASSGAWASFPTCPGGPCTWQVPGIDAGALLTAATVCTQPLPVVLPPSPWQLPCVLVYATAPNGTTGMSLQAMQLGAITSTPIASLPLLQGVHVNKGAGIGWTWSSGSLFEGVLLASTRAGSDPVADLLQSLTHGQGGIDAALHTVEGHVRRALESRHSMEAAHVERIVSSRASILAQALGLDETHTATAPMQEGVDPLDDGARAYLYGAYLTLNLTWNAAGPAASFSILASSPSRLGFGSNPRVFGWHMNGSLSYLSLSMDGSCDSGLYVNNADMSRCVLTAPSSDSDLFYSVFQSVPYTLVHDWAGAQAWQDTLGQPQEHGWLGICNRGIQHGKFENGLRPSAALFPWTVSYRNSTPASSVPHVEIGLLAVHDGTVPTPAPQQLFCGLPTTKNGLVWDAWRLVQGPAPSQ